MTAHHVQVLLHTVAAIVLLGSVSHLGLMAISRLRGAVVERARWQRFVGLVAASYLVCFVIGLAVYPVFRIEVRAAYFDLQLPLATGFFEIKEHWLALGLGLVGGLFVLRREQSAESPTWRWVEPVLALTLTLVVYLAMGTGLTLALLQSA